MDVRVEPKRRLSAEESMLSNCAAGQDFDLKEIKPVNSKGNQPWTFIGSTDAEALIIWPPDAKSRLTGKDPDAGKDWRQKEKKREWQKMRWLDRITDSVYMNLSKRWETQEPGVLQSMWLQRAGDDLAPEQQQQCIRRGRQCLRSLCTSLSILL